MPVAIGYWSKATLFAPPQLEWICPFGHGTMRQSEVHLSGIQLDQWVENDADFWKAFEDISTEYLVSELKRRPTLSELLAGLAFVLRVEGTRFLSGAPEELDIERIVLGEGKA